MRQRVTVTRVETIECEEADAQRIADAAKASGLPYERLRVSVQTLLPKPERRVVIRVDSDWSTPLDADFESEEDRADCERRIEQYGVYGFVCEQRETVDGEWEIVDSCWGFIGDDSMEFNMRAYMPKEFQDLALNDENEVE